MRRLAIILMLLLIPLSANAQISSWIGESAAQVVNVVDYQTVLDSSYFTTNVGDPIRAIIARLNQYHYTDDYSNIQDAIDSGLVVYISPGTKSIAGTGISLPDSFGLIGVSMGSSRISWTKDSDDVQSFIVNESGLPGNTGLDTSIVIRDLTVYGGVSQGTTTDLPNTNYRESNGFISFKSASERRSTRYFLIQNIRGYALPSDLVILRYANKGISQNLFGKWRQYWSGLHANDNIVGRSGWVVLDGQDLILTNCMFEDMYVGGHLENSGSADKAVNIIINNCIFNRTLHGVCCVGNAGVVEKVIVTNSIFKHTSNQGILIRKAGQVRVSNCIFINGERYRHDGTPYTADANTDESHVYCSDLMEWDDTYYDNNGFNKWRLINYTRDDTSDVNTYTVVNNLKILTLVDAISSQAQGDTIGIQMLNTHPTTPATTPYEGILTYGSKVIDISNCLFTGYWKRGVLVDGTSSLGNNSEVSITHCRFEYNEQQGVNITGDNASTYINNFKVNDNEFKNIGEVGSYAAIQLTWAENGEVNNNIITDDGTVTECGIQIGSCKNVTVSNNIIYGLSESASTGIRTGTICDSVQINDNNISDCLYSLHMRGNYCSISDNMFVNSGDISILAEEGHYNKYNDNTILAAGSYAIQIGVGSDSSSYNLIASNHIINPATRGIYLTANSQYNALKQNHIYGTTSDNAINIDTADYTTIIGTTSDDGFTDSGTGTRISDNNYFDEDLMGTSSIASGDNADTLAVSFLTTDWKAMITFAEEPDTTFYYTMGTGSMFVVYSGSKTASSEKTYSYRLWK